MTTPLAVSGPALPAVNAPDETALVTRLRAGDAAAYEELYRIHSEPMLAIARGVLRNAADAADAVQDAFVSAFRGIGRFEGTARLGTWLHRITVNHCLMHLRARKRRRLVSLGLSPAPVAAAEADGLVRAEVAADVRAGVARLPAAYRHVVELRDFEGIDTAAAAARLGTNTGVVKARLCRAHRALRGLFGTAADLAR